MTALETWAKGYGVIRHSEQTRDRIATLAKSLVETGAASTEDLVYEVLLAADRLASAAMWIVVHMTYARRVDLSGSYLAATDFKSAPEGHTGGSLNVVPAYVGYLAANLLTATTRGWILGQGHCVAAIEAVNCLVGNLTDRQVDRYGFSEAGISRLCADFYSYEIDADGTASTPLGSHVNAFTAGGVSEGGYLGFAETQYVHMPLPGESLVAILSDGAFEEQRGGDWAERWWRHEDCGFTAPVMILNGRRIEQRTEIRQDGGADWLARYLEVNGFDPIEIDGRDPAAFAWAVLESERRLAEAAKAITQGKSAYPVRLPFAIATTEKGFGFPGAGTNRAHNLPLERNPHTDEKARKTFNAGAKALFVPFDDLAAARQKFMQHESQHREKEGRNPFASRNPEAPVVPVREPFPASSALAAMDHWFVSFHAANPNHRFRVGNPDELKSNQMGATLAQLRHRVNAPEEGSEESVDGSVITALNEEAVIGAALGNKAGLNLAVSYEAFAVKMLGALRQEIIFARQLMEAGRPPQWIGVPLIVTSHTWENGKNQQSHQDPTIGEALLGEMSDVARVIFAVDAATGVEALRQIYSARGVIGCIVAPKRATPDVFTDAEAKAAFGTGVAQIRDEPRASLQLVAIGAYQLAEVRRAADRLSERGISVNVTVILEPGRLRSPRDRFEEKFVVSDQVIRDQFPPGLPRLLATHTRPEMMTGLLRRIDEGASQFRAHGYLSRGGTLDARGMLFANRCTWAHLILSAAGLLGVPAATLLSPSEHAAAVGRGDPMVLR
ncbi:MAG: xylulose 5-phosphate 3-epimerase [Hyphomonas sp.]|uniref:xylulose 5-phosphate 3-epimerase n=1 Tax=Hyphomonas sp. TaxID=87 RepID=UPI0018318A8E|nr:xylulose 5-phosphate 3-epimerase [Hyphomonas sp.]MBA3067928.1 xylulose 5-phosphate 3-epimerase [Hyphomonas sp.]MBU4061265.1 xylulose 5-phosphate 3-epimerase [Alphaproteobacteria bacterium]MBU4162518.1 xylulose 5-phosphate 3-epimerase [Alphaproteobacteria bacterium]